MMTNTMPATKPTRKPAPRPCAICKDGRELPANDRDITITSDGGHSVYVFCNGCDRCLQA